MKIVKNKVCLELFEETMSTEELPPRESMEFDVVVVGVVVDESNPVSVGVRIDGDVPVVVIRCGRVDSVDQS